MDYNLPTQEKELIKQDVLKREAEMLRQSYLYYNQ